MRKIAENIMGLDKEQFKKIQKTSVYSQHGLKIYLILLGGGILAMMLWMIFSFAWQSKNVYVQLVVGLIFFILFLIGLGIFWLIQRNSLRIAKMVREISTALQGKFVDGVSAYTTNWFENNWMNITPWAITTKWQFFGKRWLIETNYQGLPILLLFERNRDIYVFYGREFTKKVDLVQLPHLEKIVSLGFVPHFGADLAWPGLDQSLGSGSSSLMSSENSNSHYLYFYSPGYKQNIPEAEIFVQILESIYKMEKVRFVSETLLDSHKFHELLLKIMLKNSRFTQEDLQKNREYKISFKQRCLMFAKAMLSLAIGGGLALLTYPYFTDSKIYTKTGKLLTQNEKLIPGFILAFIAAGIFIYGIYYLFTTIKGRLEMLEGYIEIEMRALRHTKGRGPRYYCTVNGLMFELPETWKGLILEGFRYKVYYLPQTKELLSFEPVK